MSVLKFIEQIARQWRQEQQQHQQQRRWRQQPPCRSNSGAADTGCREDDDASEASLVEKMAVFCVPFALKTINQRRCNGHFFGDFQEKNDFVFLINFCQRATLRNVRTNRQDFWKKKRITNLRFLLKMCTNKLFCTDKKACLQPPRTARLKISDMQTNNFHKTWTNDQSSTC